MRTCNSCQQPMISSGLECGRCKPSRSAIAMIDKAVKPRKGELGDSRKLSHTDLKYFDKPAPPSKCFDFRAVSPESWPILAVAVQQLKDMAKLDYHAPTKIWPLEQTNEMSRQLCSCGCKKKGSGFQQDREWEYLRGIRA